MFETISLPDLNLYDNLSVVLAAIAGFAVAFAQRFAAATREAIKAAAMPLSGLWFRLRLMMNAKRLHDLLCGVLAAEISAEKAIEELKTIVDVDLSAKG
jgi:hypothetical protein